MSASATGASLLQNVQTCCGAYPTSYSLCTTGSLS